MEPVDRLTEAIQQEGGEIIELLLADPTELHILVAKELFLLQHMTLTGKEQRSGAALTLAVACYLAYSLGDGGGRCSHASPEDAAFYRQTGREIFADLGELGEGLFREPEDEEFEDHCSCCCHNQYDDEEEEEEDDGSSLTSGRLAEAAVAELGLARPMATVKNWVRFLSLLHTRR